MSLFCVGCVTQAPEFPVRPTIGPGPTPSPASVQPIVSASPAGSVYSDVGFEVYGGHLQVDVRHEGRPLSNARVSVFGPTLAAGSTDSEGRLRLGPLLPSSDYRVRVDAPNFVAIEQTAIDIPAREEDFPLQPFTVRPAAWVRGRVLAGGRPIEGVVVSDGSSQALTDAGGQFELRSVAAGTLTLTASKPRHTLATRAITTQVGRWTEADFILQATTAKVYFDYGVASGVEPEEMTGLRQYLETQGWQLLDAPPSQAAEGAWVMVVPGRDLSRAEQERVLNFVAQGGKFVLLGDWAGSKGFRNSSANAVLGRFGLHISPDLLRDFSNGNAPSWLTINRFQPNHPVTRDVVSLKFYGCASVFGLFPMLPLAQTGDTAFRVQALLSGSQQSLVCGGPFKGGKAVVVGDCSAFLDEDTDQNGRSNFDEADNKRFFVQMLDW
ncbi:MAG: DUF4350 domain-containing protein [Candidatus Sericytochromatia bacterium]|nr:DUF4350 domain-containing protein [Candidatus Sericytochromatia bacterium]